MVETIKTAAGEGVREERGIIIEATRENKHRKPAAATTVGEACVVSTGRNFEFFWCCDIHEKCYRQRGERG